MTLRNIVKIDETKCNGCGLCVKACAEGAIKLINGKAKLVSETYCDGLGACIGHCPQDAITIEQRQADAFDEQATKAHLAQINKTPFVCPGVSAKTLQPASESSQGPAASQLTHWPVQLKLVSPDAPYFADAHLLLVADCVPFAMSDFHSTLLRGKSIVIGCPKLDDPHFYIEKLADIFRSNKLKSLSVVHMEVPCCHGLTRIASEAMERAGMKMTFEDVTVSIDGKLERIEMIHP
jgi:Pyruvate/2-oxoacid:ferredoxin oxidoreductase delta subunit